MNRQDGLNNGDNALKNLGNSTSPITKLNQDVLWRIFSLNANMDNDEEFRVYAIDRLKIKDTRALFDTWRSSQVCQLWRDSILSTSSLWAQLIDLDGLSSVGKLMKEEVIRRTGLGALSVAGSVFASNPSEQDFFVTILHRDWTRIRRLQVTIAQSTSIPGHVWKILSEPTKTLEYFQLRANNGLNPPVENRPIGNLFSNDAPSLKSFVSWRINFDFGTSLDQGWLSNMRQLNISYMSSMSIAQWLQTLEQMPQIEDLHLIYPFPLPTSPEGALKLPPVHLPRLLNIYIIHHLAACSLFLDRIVPGVGCYLYIDTPDDNKEPLPPWMLLLATKVLSRYSQNWFANHPITTLFFTVTHAAITISEYQNPYRHSSPTYRVYICCRDPDDLPALFPILDAYASCDFSNIETLRFDVDLFPSQSLNIDVFRYLLKLHSVKSLVFSNGYTMPALYGLAQNSVDATETSSVVPVSLFPHLHTIKLDTVRANTLSHLASEGNTPLAAKLLQETLSKFVIWRRLVRDPVQVIDITDLGAEAQLGIFDGISDLKIIIRTDP